MILIQWLLKDISICWRSVDILFHDIDNVFMPAMKAVILLHTARTL